MFKAYTCFRLSQWVKFKNLQNFPSYYKIRTNVFTLQKCSTFFLTQLFTSFHFPLPTLTTVQKKGVFSVNSTNIF